MLIIKLAIYDFFFFWGGVIWKVMSKRYICISDSANSKNEMFFATIAWSSEKPFDDGTMPTNPFLDDFIRRNNNVGNNDNKTFQIGMVYFSGHCFLLIPPDYNYYLNNLRIHKFITFINIIVRFDNRKV